MKPLHPTIAAFKIDNQPQNDKEMENDSKFWEKKLMCNAGQQLTRTSIYQKR